jgi:hypothetical protein
MLLGATLKMLGEAHKKFFASLWSIECIYEEGVIRVLISSLWSRRMEAAIIFVYYEKALDADSRFRHRPPRWYRRSIDV